MAKILLFNRKPCVTEAVELVENRVCDLPLTTYQTYNLTSKDE